MNYGQGRGKLDSSAKELRGFRLFLKAYIFTPATDTFEPVPGMPGHLPRQIRSALQALQLIHTAGRLRLQGLPHQQRS